MSSSEALNIAEEQHEVTLEDALALAQGHHQSGNIVLAERTYRDILRAVPDHVQTLQFLGILLFQSGNFIEARQNFEKALEADKNDRSCWNNYGAVLTQLKDYEGAIKAYDKALEIEPDYLDAINNKTNVLWATDNFREAEDLARRALELDPDNMAALNNLGITLSKRVKFEESLDVWEKAAKANPEVATIWANWGNSLREMGKLKESEKKCRKAFELDPKNPEALNNLANALRDLGRLDEAIPLYRKATNERPDFYNAHCNLSIALHDNGLYEEAIGAARYAVTFKDDLVEGYNALSRALCEMGEFEKAHGAAQRAAQLDPDNSLAFLSLVDVLLRIDHLDDAEAAMQAALKAEPDSPRALLKLAELKERMGDKEQALEIIEGAIELAPTMPALWSCKANILYLNSEIDKALESIEEAIRLAPQWLIALQRKAEILVSVNRNEEALELVNKILKKENKTPAIYASLVGLKKFESEEDEDFQNMKALEEKIESFGLDPSISYFFTMALAYEKMGKYDKAFSYLKKANDQKSKMLPYDPEKMANIHHALRQKYTTSFLKEFSAQGGCESEIPVFIVGMPRSGTTLTEQIIASHPQVYGAGELGEIGHIIKSFNLGEISDPKELGEAYIESVKKRNKDGEALRITDKMPANFLYLGFIASILPNAKIIHCRRNPIDTCLSCYNQNFSRGQYWSYDQDNLADEYLRYLDTMEHWRNVLPGKMLEINYEDTVQNFEEQARKLIDFVGLDWNDDCLEPHKQKRAILTASKGQVTQPVYKTSVEKWRCYEKDLQPLVRKLMPELALPEEL